MISRTPIPSQALIHSVLILRTRLFKPGSRISVVRLTKGMRAMEGRKSWAAKASAALSKYFRMRAGSIFRSSSFFSCSRNTHSSGANRPKSNKIPSMPASRSMEMLRPGFSTLNITPPIAHTFSITLPPSCYTGSYCGRAMSLPALSRFHWSGLSLRPACL